MQRVCAGRHNPTVAGVPGSDATGTLDSRSLTRLGSQLPLENVSWDQLTSTGGFLQRVNESAVASSFRKQLSDDYEF